MNSLDGFARLLDESRRAAAGLPGAVVGAAAHSLRAVTPEELREVVRMHGGPFHIHVAEQTREVDDCLQGLLAHGDVMMLLIEPLDPVYNLQRFLHGRLVEPQYLQ